MTVLRCRANTMAWSLQFVVAGEAALLVLLAVVQSVRPVVAFVPGAALFALVGFRAWTAQVVLEEGELRVRGLWRCHEIRADELAGIRIGSKFVPGYGYGGAQCIVLQRRQGKPVKVDALILSYWLNKPSRKTTSVLDALSAWGATNDVPVQLS